MFAFFREGGVAIYGVLALGSVGLLLDWQRMFIWFVMRDHSEKSLRLHTTASLYLGVATFLLGALGTAVAYYVVIDRWSAGMLSDSDLRVGLKEPLPCFVIGCALTGLIVLTHGILEYWRKRALCR